MSQDRKTRRPSAIVPAPIRAIRTEEGLSPMSRTPAGDERRATRPPRGGRTPVAGVRVPDFKKSLPPEAPGWKRRARRMALALEDFIERGVTPAEESAIERAWAAWELDGSTDEQIGRVAHLVERAHEIIRASTRAASVEQAYVDCAKVLWGGLPSRVRRRVEIDLALQVVRHLRTEPDPWNATVWGTSKLLGWTDAATAHTAQTIRAALLARRP